MAKSKMKIEETEIKIESMDEFCATVDLAGASQDEMRKLNEAAKRAKAKVEAARKILAAYLKPTGEYAAANEETFFEDEHNQRAETELTVFGFKKSSNPSVQLLEGSEDEDVIARIENSKALDEELKDEFVKRTPELSRQNIIAAFKSGRVTAATLKRLGIKVECAKSFFVEKKKEA